MMQDRYGPFLGRVPEEHVVYIGDYGVDYLDPESLLPPRGVAGKKWPSSDNWPRAIWVMIFCFVALCLFSLTVNVVSTGGKIAAIRETDMPSLKNTRLGTALLAAAAMVRQNFTVTNITEVQPVNNAQNIITNNATEALVPHNVSLNNAQLLCFIDQQKGNYSVVSRTFEVEVPLPVFGNQPWEWVHKMMYVLFVTLVFLLVIWISWWLSNIAGEGLYRVTWVARPAAAAVSHLQTPPTPPTSLPHHPRASSLLPASHLQTETAPPIPPRTLPHHPSASSLLPASHHPTTSASLSASHHPPAAAAGNTSVSGVRELIQAFEDKNRH
ncbi:hypothetical protein ACLB2K_039205 [Fragaria x ananassa]